MANGTPQHSDLLDSYGANRPSWDVAGVDYYVGAPQGVALKNPATISMAGVNINTNTKSVTITGNNVTLDGYDFAGWSVVTTAANTSLIHSNFNGVNPGGTQTSVISGTQTSSNLYVGYSTIDGLSGGGHAEFLVEMEGPGLTVEYSWLKNSNSDLIGRHGQSGGNITIQNNVMEQAGMGGPAVHGDYLQVYGPNIDTIKILNNTTVQNGGITQGFFADNAKTTEIAGNTFTGDMNFFLSGSGPNTTPGSGTFSVHDNYYDPSHVIGLSYPTYGTNDKYAGSVFAHNMNMKTGKVEQDSNAPATTPPTNNPPTTTPTDPTGPTNPPTSANPAAPKIATFSNDSGVAGDGVTNDNTLTVTGTGVANTTIKVFDGGKQIGTTTTNSSGAWTYTTATLADGSHNLTATATDASGKTSAVSTALTVKIDTTAPTAPTMAEAASTAAASTAAKTAAATAANTVTLTGTAEANSTIKVFDGSNQIGTATANANGAWTYTTSALASGNHSLTSKAMDAAGNTGVASKAVTVNIPSTPTGPTDPTGPTNPGTPSTAPKIASVSNDTGVKGDGITSDNTLTLTGTAAANGKVAVFDGAKQIGTATANSSGSWTYTTSALADGAHNLTAKVGTSASSAFAVKIDTLAPDAPKIGSFSSDGKAISGGAVNADHVTLTGTAEANSVVKVFDGTKQIGTATTNDKGAWSYAADNLADGKHSFTSTASDAAGNVSKTSAAVNLNVDTHDNTGGGNGGGHHAADTVFNSLSQKWNDTVTFKGTADPYSQITIYDNGKGSVGTVKAASDGTWSLTTKSAVSDSVHNFTTKAVDSSGQTSLGTGSAVLGTNSCDTLKSTSGNDVLKGNGGHDTFVFAPNFGKDVISDFQSSGRGHDVVQFSKTVFDSFADVLSHASQSGHDVVINAGSGNTLTLKDTKLASLDKYDFHFA